MSSVADTYTRWVCTVRREMYCRSPICGLVRPGPLSLSFNLFPGQHRFCVSWEGGAGGGVEGLGVVQRLTGDYPAATASLTQALELFRDLGDRHGQAGASINLGELLSLSLAYREARGYFVRALSIARDIDTPAGEAQAREGIGRSRIQEGNRGQGAKDLQQALAIYRRIGAPEAQCV